MTSRRSEIAWAVVLVVLLAAWPGWLVWGPLRVGDGLDWQLAHGFAKEFFRAALQAGEAPWWNPHVALGRPFFADMETGCLYPPGWLFLVLPMRWALAAFLALHFALAASGVRAWTRQARGPAGWAVVLTFAWLASAPLLGRLQAGMIYYGAALCYWPWLLVVVERLAQRPAVRPLCGLVGLLTAQLLVGHPHVFWLTAWGLCFYLLARGVGAADWPARLRALGVRLALLGIAYVGALAVTAVQLLPFLDLVLQGNRGGADSGELAAAFPLPAASWLTLFIAPWDGLAGYWENNLHVGWGVGLAAAAGAVAAWRSGAAPVVRGLVVSGLACGLIALGERSPVFQVASWVLPGFSSFRLPSRFAVWLPWALVALAAWAWAGRMGAVERWRWLPGAAVAALALALVIETGVLARGHWNAVPEGLRPPAGYLADLEAREQDLAQGLAKIDSHQGAAPRRTWMPPEVVRANGGLRHGFSSATGYVALTPDRVWRALHESVGVEPPRVQNTMVDTAVFAGPDLFPYPGMNVAVAWDRAAQKFRVNPDPGPRAWLAGEAELVDPAEVNTTYAGAPERAHSRVLVEDATRLGEARAAAAGPAGPGAAEAGSVAAEVTAFSRNRVEVTLPDAARGGVLVLSEAWFPGWSATVDGDAAEVFAVNGWMRGVVVPAGTRQVVFTYFPTGLGQGALVSAMAILLLGLLWRHAAQLDTRLRQLEGLGACEPAAGAGSPPR